MIFVIFYLFCVMFLVFNFVLIYGFVNL